MKKIKTRLDKNGNNVEIWWAGNISFTPVVPLFLRVQAELIENKLGLPVFVFKNTNSVVWAQDLDGKVLGGICYEYQIPTRTGHIILNFTDPDHRGQGINAMCHPCFEEDVRRQGATSLASVVNVLNESGIRASTKAGMMPASYRMHKSL
jgi:hypothetical protein